MFFISTTKCWTRGNVEVPVYLAVCLTAAGLQQALDPRLLFAWTVRQASSWYIDWEMTQADETKIEVSDLM